jgi:hypothetical protein
MEKTTIEKAKDFQIAMIQSLALYQAMEELKGQTEEIQKQCEPMIIALAETLTPAEA